MTLEILSSDVLSPLRHGFFTRKGGASSGVFAGLNCGRGSSDQAEAVSINRARVAHAMAVEPEALATAHQVHSADVVRVSVAKDAAGVRADGLVTSQRGIAIGVLTADCAPVLFADAEAGVIGAAHAGWRGAMDGVLEATLASMTALGADPGQTVAVIGPTISQRAYEVGPDFLERFVDADPLSARFFTQGKGDRMQFDLPAFALQRLRDAGIGHAEWTRHCTYSDAERFYSYRRSVHQEEADYGRLIAAIRL